MEADGVTWHDSILTTQTEGRCRRRSQTDEEASQNKNSHAPQTQKEHKTETQVNRLSSK